MNALYDSFSSPLTSRIYEAIRPPPFRGRPAHSRQDLGSLKTSSSHRLNSPTSLRASDHFCLSQRADLLGFEAQLREHLIRMLAE
jgi:hypothetical protein